MGGSVPVFDEIILSLSSLDRIISLDEWSGKRIKWFLRFFGVCINCINSLQECWSLKEVVF